MLHKRFDFSQIAGFPIETDVLFAYMQEAYSDISDAIVKLVGNNVIISGVENIDGDITSGWIVYNGELLPFVGDGSTLHFSVKQTTTPLTFASGEQKNVKFYRYATPTVTGIALSSLMRIKDLKEINYAVGEEVITSNSDDYWERVIITKLAGKLVSVNLCVRDWYLGSIQVSLPANAGFIPNQTAYGSGTVYKYGVDRTEHAALFIIKTVDAFTIEITPINGGALPAYDAINCGFSGIFKIQ